MYKLKFDRSLKLGKTDGKYIESDLTLDLKIRYENISPQLLSTRLNSTLGPSNNFLLSYGDLVLTFNEVGLLSAIDAYSNIKNWIIEPLTDFKFLDQGNLSVIKTNHNDRANYSKKPVYFFDPNTYCLKIVIDNGAGHFFKISDHIVALVSGNQVNSLYIEKLKICMQ